MAYSDNFKSLLEKDILKKESTTIKAKVDRSNSTGKLKVHIREYVETKAYTGYTKKGISFDIETLEELDNFKTEINNFLDEVKEHV